MVPIDPSFEVLVPESAGKNDDGSGLYPIENLDPDVPWVMGISATRYYDGLIKRLEEAGYERGKTLFGFGFDFRQCNTEHCDRLEAKLKEVSALNGGSKVGGGGGVCVCVWCWWEGGVGAGLRVLFF